MNTVLTLLAIALSVTALLWLSFTDPKRRRAFARPPYAGPRRTRLAWAFALLPGVVITPIAGGPGLVLWLGTLTVVGWALIALPPGRGGALAAALDRWLGRVSGRIARAGRRARLRLAGLRPRLPARLAAAAPAPLAARVAELEQKVSRLEAELARLREGASGGAEIRLDGRGVRVA